MQEEKVKVKVAVLKKPLNWLYDFVFYFFKLIGLR